MVRKPIVRLEEPEKIQVQSLTPGPKGATANGKRGRKKKFRGFQKQKEKERQPNRKLNETGQVIWRNKKEEKQRVRKRTCQTTGIGERGAFTTNLKGRDGGTPSTKILATHS